ncbi:MAG: hypothetical protein HY774_27465 [Acidobacteria bacterium]|nr:hypothetical protein [Acidobacteriota bacterium]
MKTSRPNLRSGIKTPLPRAMVTVITATTILVGIIAGVALWVGVTPTLWIEPSRTEPVQLAAAFSNHPFAGVKQFRFSGLERPKLSDFLPRFERKPSDMLVEQMPTSQGESSRRNRKETDPSDIFPLSHPVPSLNPHITPDEYTAPVGTSLVVLGHRLWQQTIETDPKELGKSLNLDNPDYISVGVLPQALSWAPEDEPEKPEPAYQQ